MRTPHLQKLMMSLMVNGKLTGAENPLMTLSKSYVMVLHTLRKFCMLKSKRLSNMSGATLGIQAQVPLS